MTNESTPARTPAWYRARMELVRTLIGEESARISDAGGKDTPLLRGLRAGFIPAELLHREAEITALAEKESHAPLTGLELATFDTWFAMHPGKVAGTARLGSGFMNPVLVKGGAEDVGRMFAFLYGKNADAPENQQVYVQPETNPTTDMADKNTITENQPLDFSAKEQPAPAQTHADQPKPANPVKKENKPKSAPPTAPMPDVDKHQLDAIALAVEASSESAGKGALMGLDEVLRTYNPGISHEEIQAWVWHKRSYGVPMTGWEKYFTESGKTETVLVAKETVQLLNQQFAPVRTMPPGAVIGKRTKFKNEYDKENYLVVRTGDNELVYVAESKVEGRKTKGADEGQLAGLVRAGALCHLAGDLLPVPIYAFGNMYERETQLEKDSEQITRLYGAETLEKQRQIIRGHMPAPLRVENPDRAQRPKILSLGDNANDPGFFSVTELAEEAGMTLPFRRSSEAYTLRDAFTVWLDTVRDTDIPGSSRLYIKSYYLASKKFPEDMPNEERAEIEVNARVACERLFGDFLATGLRYEDQLRLNRIWNMTYNAVSAVAKDRVPVGFACSRTFKNNLLDIRPVQREGVAFMNITGSGCLAYDVGVGKTLVAIILLAQNVQSGECKRPLLVVPKPTYLKWKREMFGYHTDGQKKSNAPFRGRDGKPSTFVTGLLSGTDITLNDWWNLGVDEQKRLGTQLTRPVPERSITMVSFEGLKNIGLSSKVSDALFDELCDILENGGPEEAFRTKDKETGRKKTIDRSKIKETMGRGQKGTVCDLDTLGFDGIVVDEAHNFKNVFDSVGRDEGQRQNLFGITGSQTDRGIKLFMLSQIVQRTHGRKVCLLTATPFSNSPLEIYSMLSLVGYETLRAYNLQNIRRFFETFVLESIEYVVDLKNEVKIKSLIKSFNNKLLLQRLLYNHFDYKTGEDAGVQRPCKINFPLRKLRRGGVFVPLPADQQVNTYLDMTYQQEQNQEEIIEIANSATRQNPGAMFRALALNLDNALSPYIYEHGIPPADLTAEEFVKNSPKISFACECIRSVKAWHDARGESVSGQVVYCNRGKDFLPLIKEYLEESVGFKKRVRFGSVTLDEVEIVEGGMSDTKKDNIKEAFLSGTVKVIIGTSTIREGIDLQTRGTVLYNLYADWNPTDLQQLEGRIYRQGNRFGYVRVVQPLVVNSMDVFVYQKLEEKSARINTLWSREGKGNVLDMDSLDAEEIKYALISDPKELTRMKIDRERKLANAELRVADENMATYGMLQGTLYNYRHYRKLASDFAATLVGRMAEGSRRAIQNMEGLLSKDGAQAKDEAKKFKAMAAKALAMSARIAAWQATVPQTDKELIDIMRSVSQSSWDFWTGFPDHVFQEYKAYYSKAAKAERDILQAYGLNIDSDLGGLKDKLEAVRQKAVRQARELDSDEYKAKIYQEVSEEIGRRRDVRGNMEEVLERFAQTNIVLSYPFDNTDRTDCVIPEVECCPFNPQSAAEPDYRDDDESESDAVAQPDIDSETDGSVPDGEDLQSAFDGLEMLLEDESDPATAADIRDAMAGLEILLEDYAVAA